MNNSLIGILILPTTSFVASIIAYGRIKRYGAALMVSAVISLVVFQVVSYIHLGCLDPFFIIALIGTWCVAVGVSALVGCGYYYVRKKHHR